MDYGILIPIVAIVMFFSIPIVGITAAYLTKWKNAEVRMKAIEKGVSVPLDADGAPVLNPYERMAASRKKGIIATMAGIGILASFGVIAVVVDDPEVLAGGAFGLIPLFIGIGMFIDAWLRRRDMDKGEGPNPQGSSGQVRVS